MRAVQRIILWRVAQWRVYFCMDMNFILLCVWNAELREDTTVFCTAIQSVQNISNTGNVRSDRDFVWSHKYLHQPTQLCKRLASNSFHSWSKHSGSPTLSRRSSTAFWSGEETGAARLKHKVTLPSLKRPSRSQQERVVIKLLLHDEHKNNSTEKMIYLQLVDVSCDLLITLSMSESYFENRRQRIQTPDSMRSHGM